MATDKQGPFMRSLALALVFGTISSVLGAFAYQGIINSEVNWLYISLLSLVMTSFTWILIHIRHRLLVITISGITAYYPKGQASYLERVSKEIKEAKSIQIIGARGLDLVGDQSPLGRLLRELKAGQTLEVFLLGVESEHARLRGNFLEIERKKYQAETVSAHHSVHLLQRNQIEATLFCYDAQPRIRAIVLDEIAYVASYRAGTRGRRLPTYRIVAKFGAAYEVVSAYLEYLRKISKVEIVEYDDMKKQGRKPDETQG